MSSRDNYKQVIFESHTPNIVFYTAFFILAVFLCDYGFSINNLILLGLLFTFISYIFLKKILKINSCIYNFIALNLIFFFIGSIRHQQISSYFDNKIDLITFKKLNIKAKILDITSYSQKIVTSRLALEIQELFEDNPALVNNPPNFNKNFSWYKNKIIHVYTKQNTQLKIGNIVEIKNIEFKKIKNKEFKKYLIKEEILSNLFISKLNPKIIKKDLNIYNKITIFKNNLIEKIKSKLSPNTFAYFSLIFLGNKNLDPDLFINIKKDFSYWGLSHYIARAGLHLLMVILILKLLMSLIPVNFLTKKILFIILINIYFILSYTTIGFLRSLIMFFLYNLCNFLNLSIQTINIVALTCLFTILHNTYHIFFIDFQLSFGITFAIAVYTSLKTNN